MLTLFELYKKAQRKLGEVLSDPKNKPLFKHHKDGLLAEEMYILGYQDALKENGLESGKPKE